MKPPGIQARHSMKTAPAGESLKTSNMTQSLRALHAMMGYCVQRYAAFEQQGGSFKLLCSRKNGYIPNEVIVAPT